MWFSTFFEAQIGDPIWIWMFKALNCVVWMYAISALLRSMIQKWNNRKAEKKEDDEVVVIGFR